MDLLERLLGHDVWTTRQLLFLCHGLTGEQLDCEFDIGRKTVRATFVHVIYNIEAWTDCMNGQPIRENKGESISELIARLDRVYEDFSLLSKVVAARDGWNDLWFDPIDEVEHTFGGSIAHVITHSMHHRAQIIYMMRLHGVKGLPEGDVLSWEKFFLTS